MNCKLLIQTAPFDAGKEYRQLQSTGDQLGAVVDFVGIVRADQAADGLTQVTAIELEHYPGMSEHALQNIVRQAAGRWPLLAATVIHRVGRLQAGEGIVYIGVASSHRKPALYAVDFIMDYLKNDVPIWKKEIFPSSSRWVQQKAGDITGKNRW